MKRDETPFLNYSILTEEYNPSYHLGVNRKKKVEEDKKRSKQSPWENGGGGISQDLLKGR